MFSGLKKVFSSIYTTVTSKLQGIFSRQAIDEQAIQEIEKILIEADTGVGITKKIISDLQSAQKKGVLSGQDAKNILEQHLVSLLKTPPSIDDFSVIVLVGVNGSGKTTATGKLAAHFQHAGKKVLIVAADTFRAAATQQLAVWAETTHASLVTGKPGQDPAAVVFEGCQTFKNGDFDILLIDTAGRLQTKINLMNELDKIKRVITKNLPDDNIATLLTVDAMLGQNSLAQARIFHESTQLDGIILTKFDGTAKGGIVFAISDELNLPVMLLSYGERLEQLKSFNPAEFVKNLLG